MSQATTIDLLRHGTPVGGRRYRGQIDDPLSEEGWAEMWAAVNGARPWRQIVCSPLSRCRQFAEALGDRLALPVAEDPRLREVGFAAAKAALVRPHPACYLPPVRPNPQEESMIRAALTHVLQAPLGSMYRMSVATASISRIRSDGERPPTVLFHGRTRL